MVMVVDDGLSKALLPCCSMMMATQREEEDGLVIGLISEDG